MAQRKMMGVAVSDARAQTLVVEVTRLVRHPVYQRVVRRMKKFKVHDPAQTGRRGDEVMVQEMRPISKEKRWRLVQVVRKHQAVAEVEV